LTTSPSPYEHGQQVQTGAPSWVHSHDALVLDGHGPAEHEPRAQAIEHDVAPQPPDPPSCSPGPCPLMTGSPFVFTGLVSASAQIDP